MGGATAGKRNDEDDEYGVTGGAAAGGHNAHGGRREGGFVGLKSPDHLKKVCNMFRNTEHKHNPQKYMQNLRNNINYDNPEIFKGPVKTEIINRQHGNGYLHLKVFKILNPKKGGG
jgi:hypothetical protein